MSCIFCNIDNNKIKNTIIEETNNFWILPSVGSLVDEYGYNELDVILVLKDILAHENLDNKNR